MTTKAFVLAGGKGTRLRPFTAVLPKPLVPLGEKPILEVLMRRLKGFGLTDVTVSTGYLAELIRAVCGDGNRYGVDIDYVHEDEPLGTAGCIGLLDQPADPLIVMNGDLLTTLNLREMIDHHQAQQADVTIGLYQRDVKIDFGVVDTDDDGHFMGFREKPVYQMRVSMGVNVLSAHAQSFIEPGKRLDMPDLILRVHEAGGKVTCFQRDCFWLDIGRMDDYALAQEEFAKNEAFFMDADA